MNARSAGPRRGGDMPAALRAEARWRWRVGLMRALFPIAAFGLLAALVAWPVLRGGQELFDMETLDAELADAGRNRAAQPRFESVDSSERPYTVDAVSAWHDSDDENRIFLNRPVARIEATGEGWVAVAALEGVLDRGGEILELSGEVSVHTESGMELYTDSARIDLRAGSAVTDDPVAGSGPWGRIDATGCSWESEGGVLRCGGRPTLILEPDAAEGAER